MADRVALGPRSDVRPGTPRQVADQADLVHLHFGFDHLGPAEIRRWLSELDAAELPLVLTVHDLRTHITTRRPPRTLRFARWYRPLPRCSPDPGAAGEISRRYLRSPSAAAPHAAGRPEAAAT